MKKRNLLIILCLTIIFGISAQTQRLVLIEEATNASCGPCASQNPAFMALLNQNRDKITAVMYHWYFPGYDPMHLHNVAENNARVSFYGINGVPTAIIDGVIPSGAGFGYPGAPSGFSQALINQNYAVPSPFFVDLYHSLSPSQDSIHVVMRITAAQAIEGTFRAQMAVVEKHIQFASPPGSNGETLFHDVMKKMLPNHLGTPIPTVWEEGDYIILNQSWKLANVYNISELGVVGFIQQSGTRAVQQAGNSEPEMFSPLHNTDAAIHSLTNLTATNCTGSYSPVITLSNYGSNPLTSAEIVYSVNDGAIFSYNWSGNLNFLETAVVELPEIIFSVLPQNELEITLVNPNGIADDYAKNNTIVYDFNAAIATPSEVKLMIKLDNNPEEITWEVTDMNGDVVYSGGPYANPGEIINETMNFAVNGCYLFTIFDAGGNGIAAPGFFVLFYGSSSQIISGTSFGSQASAQFDVGGTVSTPEVELSTEISIYPNPMLDGGVIEFQLMTSERIEINLYNISGQKVRTLVDMNLEPAVHQLSFDVSGLDSGIYMLSGRIGNKVITRKLTVIN